MICVFPSLQYCHYVAGLVGVGLSQLFSASKLEDREVGQDTELANSMGLFLQKTNIIRDYLEDTQEGRAFWPQEVSSWCHSVNNLNPTARWYTSHCLANTNLNIYLYCVCRMPGMTNTHVLSVSRIVLQVVEREQKRIIVTVCVCRLGVSLRTVWRTWPDLIRLSQLFLVSTFWSLTRCDTYQT